ncbi:MULTISPECIES: hypothetical protein [unclassified Pseudoalteromonas]|uniref:hypothetical protein n=1 Tax=unclassified Pseudoalteromonas TaxID=194690 RepID=UPI0025B4B2E6|nr:MULTISPECIES: hypothetical protein [unclassified Pseudoalteromonas]MDN3379163.1 hypothetical protein [Pseudoalteromonas sp. APC 3893]MDN3387658.1 hypothetical protein [Pseudoalteromonas sp. APC 4017]
MLLRIVDAAAKIDNPQDEEVFYVHVIYQDDERQESYQTEVDKEFTKKWTLDSVSQYAGAYLNEQETATPKNILPALICYGQSLGEALLGENYRLEKYIQWIEEAGIEKLDVQIESSNPEFFTICWEALILPESKYTLATQCRTYNRCRIDNLEQLADAFSEPVSDPFAKRRAKPLVYDLSVPVNDPLAALQVDTEAQSQNENQSLNQSSNQNLKEHRPLRVLHILAPLQSLPQEYLYDTLRQHGAVVHELFISGEYHKLEQRLNQPDDTIHIVHFHGQCRQSGEQLTLEVGQQSFFLEELVILLAEYNIRLLCADFPPASINDGSSVLSANQKLAELMAEQRKVNLVAMSYATDHYTSMRCFRHLYQQLASGRTLFEALVQVRGIAQAESEFQRYRFTPSAFHYWFLPVIYAAQDVLYFKQSITPVALHESPQLGQLRERLFGFNGRHLPPELEAISGQQLLSIYALLESSESLKSSTIAITGARHVGKTQLMHQVTLLSCYTNIVDKAFYYDLRREELSIDDMKSMLFPVLGIDSPNQITEALSKPISKKNYLFVFDHVGANSNTQVRQFATELLSLGQKVLVNFDGDLPDDVTHFEVSGLATQALTAITVEFMRKQAQLPSQVSGELPTAQQEKLGELDSVVENLLSHTRSPLLLKYLGGFCAELGTDELPALCHYLFSEANENHEVAFFQWCWQRMSSLEQGLLSIVSSFQDLYLETFMVGTKPAAQDAGLNGPSAQQNDGKTTYDKLCAQLRGKELEGDELGKDRTEEEDKQSASPDFAQFLKNWRACGFISIVKQGHLLTERARQFLADQSVEQHLERQEIELKKLARQASVSNDNKTSTMVSDILLNGFARISASLNSQPNPHLSYHFLLNRKALVPHLERVWFDRAFSTFFTAKAALEQLMLQEGLGEEMAQWSLALLEKTDTSWSFATQPKENQYAWLTLAESSLTHASVEKLSAAQAAILAKVASLWLTWFDELDSLVLERDSAVHKVGHFLELYFLSNKKWQEVIKVSTALLESFQLAGAWMHYIKSAKFLASAYRGNGQANLAIATEDKLLLDVPFEKAPPGFEQKESLDILANRLAHGQPEEALRLIESLEQKDWANQTTELLSNLKAEALYGAKNYLKALPRYCELWSQAIQTEQVEFKRSIEQVLVDIRDKVTDEEFEQVYQSYVPANLPTPEAKMITH